MRTTPTREIRPPSCSVRVKGSLMNLEQAQQDTVGARKVMTVASDRGRYCKDPKGSITVRHDCIENKSEYLVRKPRVVVISTRLRLATL